MILSPSMLSADFGHLAETLDKLRDAGLSWVHWDVMDGRFVPNITFGQHVLRQMRPLSPLFFDVHLMIEEPERYLGDFRDAGADLLVVHAEATRHLQRTLAEIRRLGMKAGVALNPATPLDVLDYVLDDVDLVLIMSVNPGFGGQSFLPRTLDKVADLARRLGSRPAPALAPRVNSLAIRYLTSVSASDVASRPESGAATGLSPQPASSPAPHCESGTAPHPTTLWPESGALRPLIEVDGGVDPGNAGALVAAGADVLVSGSAFFSHPPFAERLAVFEAAAVAHRA